jgi:hypothetical protein
VGHITRRLLITTALFTVVAGGVAGAAVLDAAAPSATTRPATTSSPSTLPPPATSAPAPTTTTTTLVPVATEPAAEPTAADDDPIARAEAALAAVVPARWRSAVPVRFVIIAGSISRSHDDGLIEVATGHLDGPLPRLQFVLAHELGHQLAYRFGTGAYLGAGPAGFPAAGAHPEEYWADCVATAFTGTALEGHDCAPDALAFTTAWLGAGPPA